MLTNMEKYSKGLLNGDGFFKKYIFYQVRYTDRIN